MSSRFGGKRAGLRPRRASSRHPFPISSGRSSSPPRWETRSPVGEPSGSLGNILIEGHQDRAFELLTEAMAEPGLLSEDEGYVEMAESLAKLSMRRSRFAEAIEIAERALPAAESRGLTVQTVELLTTRAVSLSNIGRADESVASLMGVIALADRHNIQGPLLRATINLGYALDPDDPEAAYRVSREGAAKARQWGQRFGLRYLVGNATNARIQVGDWDWALGEARDPIWDDANRPSGSGWDRSRPRSSRLAVSRWLN